MSSTRSVDKVFFGIVLTLLFSGLIIFISASLGSLAGNSAKFANLLVSQLGFGLGLGGIALFFTSRIKYTFWRKYAFWIFLTSILLSILVFIPGIGMEHGGARRWIDIGITTIQPGEILKFGVIVYLAAWLTFVKKRIQSVYFGFYPLMIMLGIAGALLLGQPDTGTFLIAVAAGGAMYVSAGANKKELAFLIFASIILLGCVALWKPYVMDRITTLIHHDDMLGSGYQIRQSLIGIGTGGVFGKGLGQSIQKFNFLPEAQGDSVFAVASEEFGFVGSTFLVLMYVLFALRGLWIASRASDKFGGLLAVGLVILITAQSFVNIGSMIAVLPLTGVPLIFISQGGTALMVAMFEVGILLNISRYRRL